MAKTFTGLKLQCETAKFGQLELSDVSSFYELPDGKVISGTEYGSLIVWEGQFVKAHLMLDVEKQVSLHQGMVEVIIQDDQYFVSAGADGYIKWWKMNDIDSAEADEGVDVAIVPTKEILIAENEDGKNPAHIMNITVAGNKYYIQDGKGKIYCLNRETDIYTEVYKFTEGAIMALASSPIHNYVVSLGESGEIKVWDYAKKETFFSKDFVGAGTSLDHCMHTDANKGRLVAAGFGNGIVRFLNVSAEGLEVMKAFKAHDDAIVGVKCSNDMKMLCTASLTGDIFFYVMDGHKDTQLYEPLCTLKLPNNSGINDFSWNPDDKSVLFGCNNGSVFQVDRPDPTEIDNSDSYYWDQARVKEWVIKIMEFQMQKNQKKDEAEEEKKRRMRLRGELQEEEETEEVWDPQAIRTIIPFLNKDGVQQFLITS